jgi:hypothetical protein
LPTDPSTWSGAYFGYQLVAIWELNFWIALVLAGLGAGLVGMLAESLFLRRIYGRVNEGGFQILLTYCSDPHYRRPGQTDLGNRIQILCRGPRGSAAP